MQIDNRVLIQTGEFTVALPDDPDEARRAWKHAKATIDAYLEAEDEARVEKAIVEVNQ